MPKTESAWPEQEHGDPGLPELEVNPGLLSIPPELAAATVPSLR